MIGRRREWETLSNRDSRDEAQFLAVYGRRRVGKTFLIESFFKEKADLVFKSVGRHNGSKSQQLANFRIALEKTFASWHSINSWDEAFRALASCLEQVSRNSSPRSVLVFLDELPWMDTKRSGLIDALGHSWESELKKFPFLRLVICGSSASWMINNVINDNGSLHNRVVEKIRVEPFFLKEVEEFLLSKKVTLSRSEIIQLYLFFGGIPYYLDQVRDGESPIQVIARTCFASGTLAQEKDVLFQALFSKHENHEEIIEFLSIRRGGFTRQEIQKKTKISGKSLTKSLRELTASGFIAILTSWKGLKKEDRYILFDPFLLFEFKCKKSIDTKGVMSTRLAEKMWLQYTQSQSFKILQGYAFENLCLWHIERIVDQLGLSNIPCRPLSWRKRSSTNVEASDTDEPTEAQVDLLLDRADGRISLIEAKNLDDEFETSKRYADSVNMRLEIFRKDTKTKKSIDNILVCSRNFTDNEHFRRTFSRGIKGEDLFG